MTIAITTPEPSSIQDRVSDLAEAGDLTPLMVIAPALTALLALRAVSAGLKLRGAGYFGLACLGGATSMWAWQIGTDKDQTGLALIGVVLAAFGFAESFERTTL